MIATFDLGSSRQKGEVVEINEKTIRVKPLTTRRPFGSGRLTKSKIIKRHLEKHNVTFDEGE